MEGVEVKTTEVTKEEVKAPAPAPKAGKKSKKADPAKVQFMELRNEARKNAGLPEAYSKEVIDSFR